MKRTATAIRCMPRCGFETTEVRTIDLDLPRDLEEQELLAAVNEYFAVRGISEAVYDVGVDDYGWYAIINDEAYAERWGTPLL